MFDSNEVGAGWTPKFGQFLVDEEREITAGK
jgi:hypothetical protein